MTLNNSPIADFPVRRWTAEASSAARSGLASVSAAARTPIPSRFSHSPCETSRRDLDPADRRLARERLEIDVRGQILLARLVQQRSERMAAHRLERLARGACFACP